jgi:hypothetical protein
LDRKVFADYVVDYLDKKNCSTSNKDVQTILNGLIECILQVVESGDEVRTPVGTFFPRVVLKHGTRDIGSVKLGFTAFSKANERITSKVKNLAAYRLLPKISDEPGEVAAVQEEPRLYNLSEISRLANLSYPTTRKYVLDNPDKIPCKQTGTSKKYPIVVVDIILAMCKKKNVYRKDYDGLYTLTDIAKRTNISTVTLSSYLTRYSLGPAKVENGRALYDEAFLQKVSQIRSTNKELWGS